MWSRLLGIVATTGGILTVALSRQRVERFPAVPSVKQTPTWLALIFLFFSPRMLALWRRVAAGIFAGLLADQLTETNHWPLWWRALF